MGRHREKEPPMEGLKPKKYKSGRSPVDMSFYPPETPVGEEKQPVNLDGLFKDMHGNRQPLRPVEDRIKSKRPRAY